VWRINDRTVEKPLLTDSTGDLHRLINQGFRTVPIFFLGGGGGLRSSIRACSTLFLSSSLCSDRFAKMERMSCGLQGIRVARRRCSNFLVHPIRNHIRPHAASR